MIQYSIGRLGFLYTHVRLYYRATVLGQGAAGVNETLTGTNQCHLAFKSQITHRVLVVVVVRCDGILVKQHDAWVFTVHGVATGCRGVSTGYGKIG